MVDRALAGDRPGGGAALAGAMPRAIGLSGALAWAVEPRAAAGVVQAVGRRTRSKLRRVAVAWPLVDIYAHLRAGGVAGTIGDLRPQRDLAAAGLGPPGGLAIERLVDQRLVGRLDR